jgi:ABC-type Fe3+-hydroxamate transport system substrate-binding protein
VRRLLAVLVPCLVAVAVACARTESASSDTASSGSVSSAPTRAPAAPADTDDFGAPLPTDARFAARVVSLNPAATEAIFTIGAQAHLVGRSRWDEQPAAAKAVPALGDGIRPNIEAVLAARPTLVVLYATAENRAAAAALQRAGGRTLLQVLGRALGAEATAAVVSDSVRATLDRVRALTASQPRPRVVWPVWESPVLVIGAGSYLDELLTIAGADNAFHDLAAPSPGVSIEEIASRDPDLVAVSASRATAMAAMPAWRAVRAVREQHFLVHDPALTGRPSVVLGMAATQLARALHPALRDSLK